MNEEMNNPISTIKETIEYLQAPERLKDNIELVSGLIDAQKAMLDMQEKQLDMQTKLTKLLHENDELKSIKRFVFADGRKYLIDPDNPERPLCPVCTIELKSPVPMYNKQHCT